MDEVSNDFRERVYGLVAQIPRGRVMTYGQIASLAGSPRAARIVGGIAHLAPCTNQLACSRGLQPADLATHRQVFDCDCSLHCTSCTARSAARQETCRCTTCKARGAGSECPAHELPWQRVVKKDGALAEGYPGGIAGHEEHLLAEGVEIINGRVSMAKHLWFPG